MTEEIPKREKGVMVVNGPTKAVLTDRQFPDYAAFKIQFIRWLGNVGKSPKQAEGYAHDTVQQTSQATDRFYRWLWETEGGYTTGVTPENATGYMNHLVVAEDDYSNSYLSNTQKALKRLFKYRRAMKGATDEWDPDFSFGTPATNVRDYLTLEERRQIREAALEYGAIPSRKGLDAEERDHWRTHLSQRFEKPKSEVTPQDWDRANGWKIPSLVWVSLDTGLRPVEVKRATVGWVDVENRVLRIPKAESSKNQDHWIVGITDRTADALARWLSERELYEKYAETDALWLTRQGNPYGSSALIHVLTRLFKEAGIPTDNRQVSWYSIRHSVGTYMTRQEDLAAAQAQLRHKSPETTMRYDQTPVEDRREALNRMG